MRLLMSLSANIDPEEFVWKRYNGSRKRKYKNNHQKHELVLEKGDVYGVKQTRSRTPNFQILHSDKMHVLFRNFTLKDVESLDKVSKDYRGKTPSAEALEEGRVRRKRTSTKDVVAVKANKLKDSHYKPARRVNEKLVVDKENYQWRTVKTSAKPFSVKSKKQGKVVATLSPGDTVGMRFVSPSKGGYIILPGGERRNIDMADYDRLVENARILPTRYQKTGLIDQAELKKALKKDKSQKKPTRMKPITIEPKQKVEPVQEPEELNKLYDLDSIDDADVLKHVKNTHKAVRRVKRHLKKHSPELFDEEGEEEIEEDFEGWFDGQDDAEEDFEDETDMEEPNDEPSVDTGDTDVMEDEGLLVEELEPGSIVEFKQASSKRYVFVTQRQFERNERLIEYFFAEDVSESDDSMTVIRLDEHYTVEQFRRDGAKVVGVVEAEELRDLQNSLEYADIKRMSFFK